MAIWTRAWQLSGADGASGWRRLQRLAQLGEEWVRGKSVGSGWMLDRTGHASFWLRTDAENWATSRFLREAAQQLAAGDVVLDAGAQRYYFRPFFRAQRYYSCDWQRFKDLGFMADLSCLPVASDCCDAVVCTQVLEHVRDPQGVLNELFRALRPGGKLFLTVPQGWALHEEPHNYFYFTRYGLELLFQKAGFDQVTILEKGGIFWFLAKRIRSLVLYFHSQYSGVAKAALFFLHLLLCPLLTYIIPLTFFYLDALDRKKGHTLGYVCTCRKPV